MNCWLAQFSSKPCDGPEDFAHILSKQWLRKAGIEDVWDRRWWVPACRLHHANWDNLRLVVPRSAIPKETEILAEVHGIGHLLDRRYGPIVDPATKP